MQISSPAFQHEASIPKKFTGEGEDISPPLAFLRVPPAAQSLVLIVDDPDAPRGTFLHWMVWNIPADTKALGEGYASSEMGKNDFGAFGWRGPMPPPGKPHRYYFKLFALDTKMQLSKEATLPQLQAAMEGHILSKAELIGTYQR